MKKFNEIVFLTEVKRNTVILRRVNDKTSKNLIQTVIRTLGYDKWEVLDYFHKLLKENMSKETLKDGYTLSIEGLKRLFNFFIHKCKDPYYSDFGKELEKNLPYLHTQDEFELSFTTCAEKCGVNWKLILTEIVIGSLGWLRFHDTLINMVDEMGIVVDVEPYVAPKKRSEPRPVVQLTLEGEFISRFDSSKEAEEMTGVKKSTIDRLCKNSTTKVRGEYRWMYEEEYEGVIPESPVVVPTVVESTEPSMVEPTTPIIIEKSEVVESTEPTTTTKTETLDEIISCEEDSTDTTTEPETSTEIKLDNYGRPKGNQRYVVYYLNKDKSFDFTRSIGQYKTQEEISNNLGIAKPTVSNYLKGRKHSLKWVDKEGVKCRLGIRIEEIVYPEPTKTAA